VQLVVVGIGVGYLKFVGTPEVKRDRALTKAGEYMKQAKVNEAVTSADALV
jgi:hypothetical protein